MPQLMDYMISPYPIRIIDPKVEASRLRLKSVTIHQAGHLPGRILFRSEADFEHWALVLITAGAGSFLESGGRQQQVRAGSLFFFRPGYSYNFGPSPGGFWDEYYISFNGKRVEEWREAGLLAGGTVFQNVAVHKLQTFFEEVLSLMDSGDAEEADLACLTLERMLLGVARQTGTQERPQSGIMRQLRADLQACVYGRMEPAQIAAKHHISLSTLRRQVRSSTGYPLHEYIHRLKMAEAKHLLLNTSLQVQEIAGMLHYGDPFYFSRLYKKYMGVSPQISRSSL
ncbi:helix-turn-helix transcriptional regulator ['Paenibacillus yunnanensis' Narsing Rao et al. 2020]|uniref:helix-turn-helix transcriptional regulator n=1 Tax=Paenibacillus tengchongensis TaxID=2608684 RepID=UPI00124C4E11|nr:AraC family transcriptional regulator [Paenibacillus tengchongensis]